MQLTRYRSQITLYPNQTSRTFLAFRPAEAIETDTLLQSSVVAGLDGLLRGQPPTPVVHHDVALVTENANLSPEILLPHRASRHTHRQLYLREQFPTVSPDHLYTIFPLLDPLDLDVAVSWSIPATDRKGITFLHAVRLAPEFSIVETIRRQLDATNEETGGAQKRTMYEETGRLRDALVGSILVGVLGREKDPVVVRVGAKTAVKGRVEIGLDMGVIPVAFEIQNRSPVLPVRWILRLPGSTLR
jgi:hypothetical protein